VKAGIPRGVPPVTFDPFAYLKSKFFALLRLVAPEGSELDTIFGSYGDWVKAREESFKSRAKK
jgi:hypothetical protein